MTPIIMHLRPCEAFGIRILNGYQIQILYNLVFNCTLFPELPPQIGVM